MTDKPSLTLKRQLKASPARIFKAWTDPAKLVHWWGPHDTEEGSVEAETDLRVGGAFRIRLKTSDGRSHEASGTYQEIAPNEGLVMTWLASADAPGLVTVTFRGEAGGTMLTLTHDGLADEASRASHQAIWAGAIERLERFVTRGGKK
ncbi:SRPBCC domain-containing protein [Kaistia defluvii]|uniref:SRPBCC family protein n=1 Tax=Kaistia defluvii TaxID=410841 RepID=UPI00224D9A29|nr:SRPBCC domain-containing protein [Kaistia defluvii]MCX5516827.1 SRPBCC domain-containing protein [Kaistia defluvii]